MVLVSLQWPEITALIKRAGNILGFLDDDDYLYPSAAEQLIFIESHHADVCSAPLQSISSDGIEGEFLKYLILVIIQRPPCFLAASA